MLNVHEEAANRRMIFFILLVLSVLFVGCRGNQPLTVKEETNKITNVPFPIPVPCPVTLPQKPPEYKYGVIGGAKPIAEYYLEVEELLEYCIEGEYVQPR